MPLSEHKIYVQHLLIPNDALLIPAGLLLAYTIERLECVSLYCKLFIGQENLLDEECFTQKQREKNENQKSCKRTNIHLNFRV